VLQKITTSVSKEAVEKVKTRSKSPRNLQWCNFGKNLMCCKTMYASNLGLLVPSGWKAESKWV